MNTTIVSGNMTANPEMVFTPSGKVIVEFSIGVNRRFKKADGETGEEVSFIPCKAFGRTGEIAVQYLEKGDLVAIQGRLRQESWEKDGQRRSKIVVVVEKLDLMPNANRKDSGGEVSDEVDKTAQSSKSRKRQTAKAA